MNGDYWLDEPAGDRAPRELALAIASDGIGAEIEIVAEPLGAAYRGVMTGYDYDTATVTMRCEYVRLLAAPPDAWIAITPAAMTLACPLREIIIL